MFVSISRPVLGRLYIVRHKSVNSGPTSDTGERQNGTNTSTRRTSNQTEIHADNNATTENETNNETRSASKSDLENLNYNETNTSDQTSLNSDSLEDTKTDIMKTTSVIDSNLNQSESSSDDPNLSVLTESHQPPKLSTDAITPGLGPPPELPTTCCQSGCANCVWLEYADQLVRYYRDGTGRDRALQEIEKLEDPMLKAFLKLELS